MVAAGLSIFVLASSAMAIDIQLFYLLHSVAGKSDLFDQIIVFFAVYFPYLVILVFAYFVFTLPKSRQEKMSIFLVSLGSALVARLGLVEIIRSSYHRLRPFVALSFTPLFSETSWSFPSGHATFFFAIATGIYFYDKQWGRRFLLFALLISLARVAAGVHYPSDIVAGALLGAGTAYFISKISKRWLVEETNQTP